MGRALEFWSRRFRLPEGAANPLTEKQKILFILWQSLWQSYDSRKGQTWDRPGTDPLSESTRRSESIAFGLRMREGIAAEWLDPWPSERSQLVNGGLLEVSDAQGKHLVRQGLRADLEAGSA